MALLVLLSVGMLIVGFGAFGVIGVITPISRDLALTPVGAGWIVSAYAVAYAIGSPLGASITGRLDRRAVLVIGMGLIAAGALVTAVAAHPPVLYAGRIVLAVGAGLYSPAAAGVAMMAVPTAQRGRALATVYSGLTVSQVIGIPAAGYIGFTIGWPWLFIAIAAVAVLMAAALWMRVPARISIAPATLGDLARAMTDPRLALAVLVTVTVMGAAWIPYTFLSPIIEEKTGGGPGLVAILLVVYGCGSVAGNALGGFLVDRIGANRTLLIAASGPLPLMAAVTFVAWGPWLGGVILFLWGMLGWTIGVSQQARLVALDPARMQVLLSLNAACIYGGAALGSSLAGVAKSLGGTPGLGVAAVGLGLVGLAHLALSLKLGGRRDY
ncbi:MAG: MFS transporter [Phreatobacter sp.]|uniref:MFS transporter n=1 Tax=Phreatobacter sp. TaxID=1966341 RepID=UPI00403592D4